MLKDSISITRGVKSSVQNPWMKYLGCWNVDRWPTGASFFGGCLSVRWWRFTRVHVRPVETIWRRKHTRYLRVSFGIPTKFNLLEPVLSYRLPLRPFGYRVSDGECADADLTPKRVKNPTLVKDLNLIKWVSGCLGIISSAGFLGLVPIQLRLPYPHVRPELKRRAYTGWSFYLNPSRWKNYSYSQTSGFVPFVLLGISHTYLIWGKKNAEACYTCKTIGTIRSTRCTKEDL